MEILPVGAAAVMVFLGLAGFLRGARPIFRVVRAESIKITSHPFLISINLVSIRFRLVKC